MPRSRSSHRRPLDPLANLPPPGRKRDSKHSTLPQSHRAPYFSGWSSVVQRRLVRRRRHSRHQPSGLDVSCFGCMLGVGPGKRLGNSRPLGMEGLQRTLLPLRQLISRSPLRRLGLLFCRRHSFLLAPRKTPPRSWQSEKPVKTDRVFQQPARVGQVNVAAEGLSQA